MTGSISSVAVAGVAHPGVVPFFDDYLDSMRRQTHRDFQLVIADDGFPDLENRLGDFDGPWQRVPCSGSSVDVRWTMLQTLMEQEHDVVVFTDLDDEFAPDRIAVSIETLLEADICVNDLDLIDRAGLEGVRGYFARWEDRTVLDGQALVRGNAMGLGNTSIRGEVLRTLRRPPPDAVAIDWTIFASALAEGARALFRRGGVTRYRVYTGNMAGLPQVPSAAGVRSSLPIMAVHYCAMVSYGGPFPGLAEWYEELAERSREEEWAAKTAARLRAAMPKRPLWWEPFWIERGDQ